MESSYKEEQFVAEQLILNNLSKTGIEKFTIIRACFIKKGQSQKNWRGCYIFNLRSPYFLNTAGVYGQSPSEIFEIPTVLNAQEIQTVMEANI